MRKVKVYDTYLRLLDLDEIIAIEIDYSQKTLFISLNGGLVETIEYDNIDSLLKGMNNLIDLITVRIHDKEWNPYEEEEPIDDWDWEEETVGN